MEGITKHGTIPNPAPSFSVAETIKNRYSARTYINRPLSDAVKDKIADYIPTLSNPFGIKVSFHLLETLSAANPKKLGTYGMIKGAQYYIGATVNQSELALEALGYEFEKLILYATSLSLGTCWLGGTFNRGEFATAMSVKENELFPIISPVGYSAARKSLVDSLARKLIKADQRLAWETLFFANDFATPLSAATAGDYAFALEMLRLAPSASNKQPWRIVYAGNAFHFYEAKAPGYSDRLGYDIQQVDLGIAACHFHLAALEKKLAGKFEKLPEPALATPAHTHYRFSWVSA